MMFASCLSVSCQPMVKVFSVSALQSKKHQRTERYRLFNKTTHVPAADVPEANIRQYGGKALHCLSPISQNSPHCVEQDANCLKI